MGQNQLGYLPGTCLCACLPSVAVRGHMPWVSSPALCKLGIVVHTCDPNNTQEVETEDQTFKVSLRASLSYTRPCLKEIGR